MTKDLTPGMDKPMWPLTSYGPAKNEPTLITRFDESPEELRYRAVSAAKTGQISEYVSQSVTLDLSFSYRYIPTAQIRI